MTDQLYTIRDYCTIRNQQVFQDGRLLLERFDLPVSSFLGEIYRHFGMNYPKFHKMDNLCKLGFLVAELLLKDKNIHNTYASDATGIILFNSSSSLDTDRNHQNSIHDRSAYYPSPSVFVYTLANIVIGEICIRHKLYGESTFFIEEKFNARRLHGYVKMLLDAAVVECCITGWVELNGEHYDAVLYLIEKSPPDTEGIVIFDPVKLTEIYSRQG
jgi:hypothetical protein